METTAGAFIHRDRFRKLLLTPSTTPSSGICSLLSKQVFLHDWWLIKTDLGSHGKGLGVGGINHRESRSTRIFSSAPIVKRHDAVTLETIDGMIILLHGPIDRSRTLEHGFPPEVSDDFLIGFPYYWEEFAAVSVSEEPTNISVSEGISCPDACKTPAPADHGTNVLNRDNFDDAMKTNSDDVFQRSVVPSARKGSSQSTESNETPSELRKVNAEQSNNVEDVVAHRQEVEPEKLDS